MLRNLATHVVLGLLVVILLGDLALAQDSGAWPEFPTGAGGRHGITRGPGGYLSWLKLIACWVTFLGWVATTDWANRDCQRLNLSYSVWNPIVFFPFFIGFFVFLLSMPLFVIGFPLALLCWLVPILVYTVKRNSVVEPYERVLTRDHLRHAFAQQVQKMGGSMSSQKKAAHELGAPVDLKAKGGTEDENQANIIWARQTPGFLPAKEMIAKSFDRRADRMMMDFSRDTVTVSFQIDGVWHEDEALERDQGDPILAVLKRIAAMDIKERRARQSGFFHAAYKGNKHDFSVTAQGTKTGERVVVQKITTDVGFHTLEELGMREKMRERFKELLRTQQGMILFSSIPAGGLTSTVSVALSESDRYMREYAKVLEKKGIEPEVENVEVHHYDSAAGQTPANILPALIRKQPDALVVYDLSDAETVKILCDYVTVHEQLVLGTVRAKEAVEALLRVLLTKAPADQFAPVVTAVLNQRLVRMLCDACKEAYAPSAELLKKLGIPAGRIQSLYRPPENPDDVCKKCNGIGYHGRTSIFELLIVDDKLRQALQRQPKLDVLRKLARQGGNRNLQDEGIAMVARGVTSLTELNRVLKQ